jgi:hypothetical protein
MAGQTYLLAHPYEPFRRIVLVPPDSIAVVHGKLMMEVVVSFTDSDQSGDDMVTRSMLIIERSVTEPVSERVYTEGRLGRSVRKRAK